MVLIDNVLEWSDKEITSETSRHLADDFPLAEQGRAPAAVGIEIAAQTMAIHVALIQDEGAKQGLLASVRNVLFRRPWLDITGDPLAIQANADRIGIRGCTYSFEITAGADVCVEGRLGVVLT